MYDNNSFIFLWYNLEFFLLFFLHNLSYFMEFIKMFAPSNFKVKLRVNNKGQKLMQKQDETISLQIRDIPTVLIKTPPIS